MVPTKLKSKIINGDYISLGLLIEIVNGAEPNDDTKYFSLQDSLLALAPKSRAKIITNTQTWTDAFLIYASIYSSAHLETRTHLFKYICTIKLGASKLKTLGLEPLIKNCGSYTSTCTTLQPKCSPLNPYFSSVTILIIRGSVTNPSANINMNA
jgi:hypothetical protein